MWRRAYLFLVVVRLYLALSPSYLHPDEHFQGPEFIAGRIFSYPVRLTWEFTSENPIRSIFPLWLVYGWPMQLLQWLWEGLGYTEVPPEVAFWTLRIVMLVLTLVLEDGAIHELVHSSGQRRVAVMLTASSYVTWTYQAHTFSNSIETLALLWCMVLVERIIHEKQCAGIYDCALFAFLAVAGTFNRITFPAFLIVYGLRLFAHLLKRPLLLACTFLSGIATAIFAIVLDTSFYHSEPFMFQTLFRDPVVTPLNNLLYNTSTINLSKHGLHPYYQHFIVNLPQLLGPAFIALLFTRRRSPLLLSAFSGSFILSFFSHQEARFLLPAVPLALSAVQVPINYSQIFLFSWILFNSFMGVLMGIFHQGGIVPAQLHLASNDVNLTHAFWWRTYSPPTWLLDGKTVNATTTDLMGMPVQEMIQQLTEIAPCGISTEKLHEFAQNGNFRDSVVSTDDGRYNSTVYLVSPLSATDLDAYVEGTKFKKSAADADAPRASRLPIYLTEVWRTRRHLNLDDLDFGDDGVWPTLRRVVGRRGLAIWSVSRFCAAHDT